MFLEHQISILEWLLRDHVTLKTGVMAADFQLCYHRNKSCFKKWLKQTKTVILNCNITFLYKINQINTALVNMRLSKKKGKKWYINITCLESWAKWKYRQLELNQRKSEHLTGKAHTHILSNWNDHSVPFFICWFVYALPYCLIEQIQHDRTSLYMILSFQNDSVHKNINPNKGAAEYFGDFSV